MRRQDPPAPLSPPPSRPRGAEPGLAAPPRTERPRTERRREASATSRRIARSGMLLAALPWTLAAALLTAPSCGGAPAVLGEPVGTATPVTIAEIRENPRQFAGREVVLEGTLTAVCPTSGCFFDLADGTGRLTIDLEGGRHFTVPADAGGSRARVRAVVVREEDAPLHAVGRGVELR